MAPFPAPRNPPSPCFGQLPLQKLLETGLAFVYAPGHDNPFQ